MQPFVLLWLISSALDSAKGRQTLFAGLFQPQPRRWPGFTISVALHFIVLIAMPAVVEHATPETYPEWWEKQIRISQALRIRIPERLYVASGGRRETAPAARAGTRRRAGGGARRTGQTAAAAKPALTVSKRQLARLRRRFELPPMRRRTTDEQTIIQPQFPPDLAPAAPIRLAEVFFWAPQIHSSAAKPFVMPGFAEIPVLRPRLDAAPGLEMPRGEPPVALAKVPDLADIAPPVPVAPLPSMPIRIATSQSPSPVPEGPTADPTPGDPTNILSLSVNPRPLREILTVLPGNQLGAMPETASESGPARTHVPEPPKATGHPGEKAAEAAKKTGGAGASGTAQHAQTADKRGGEAAAERVAAALNPPRVEPPLPGPSETQPNPAGAEGGQGAPDIGLAHPAAAPAPGPHAGADALPAAVAATRLEHPSKGVFDIVVQSAALDGFPESAGVLSGKPVYSVFLNVGTSKEWILQYALPPEEGQSSEAVSEGVVRLGSVSRLAAPYPRVTFRPAIQRRSRSSYVMVHGYVNAEGRFEGLRVLGANGSEEGGHIVSVLDRWEFRPAVKDDRPVRVEILLAIPQE